MKRALRVKPVLQPTSITKQASPFVAHEKVRARYLSRDTAGA